MAVNFGSSEPQHVTYQAESVTAAANLGREAERARAVEHTSVGVVARVLDRDERLEVQDLEHTLVAPRDCRGEVVIYDPNDFVSYVGRLANKATTLWADPDRSTITAVFDDHAASTAPGWRRSRALLRMRPDPEWVAWAEVNGKLRTQEAFAEFLEDHAAAVIEPDSATMLEIATSFQAHRSASFERGTRLQSGDVQLRWVETTTASAGSKGHLEVPDRFTIRVAPFHGVAPVDMVARLRYRIREGQLGIGFALHRPDLVIQEAFDRVRAIVAEHGKSPIHLGAAPPSLHPKPYPAF
jgi:uncharacterized protein YfdQ (DUF2303 family)